MDQLTNDDSQEKFHPFLSDYEVIEICDRTDLNEEELNICWKHAWAPAMNENRKVDFKEFITHFYMEAEVITLFNEVSRHLPHSYPFDVKLFKCNVIYTYVYCFCRTLCLIKNRMQISFFNYWIEMAMVR